MNYQTHLTIKSSNAKTGDMPVSTTTGKTCPTDCPFQKSGCYADSGPLKLHWDKVTKEERGTLFQDFLVQIKQLPDDTLWRHNQAGDLPGERNHIDEEALTQLVEANRGKRGFTYTHKPVLSNDKHKRLVEFANKNGFTINLSGNNLKHADKLKELNIGPVVTVLPSTVEGKQNITTPNGHRVIVCPATYRDDVTCKSCKLCSWSDREVIIGFPAHGTSKKKADTAVQTFDL